MPKPKYGFIAMWNGYIPKYVALVGFCWWQWGKYHSKPFPFSRVQVNAALHKSLAHH